MYDAIQVTKTASSVRTSAVTHQKTLHSLITALWPASSILARRIAFPLVLITAGPMLAHPCARRSGTWSATGDLTIARRRRGNLLSLTAAATLLLLILASATVFGGSATWKLNPTDGFWGTASNWTPATVPDGPDDTATFNVSNGTGVTLDDETEVNGIVFDSGASSFTTAVVCFASFPTFVTISGLGITNDSGITQNFVIGMPDLGNEVDASLIQFTNSATAGNLIAFTNTGGPTHYHPYNGVTSFYDTSRAGTSTFTNNGSTDVFALGGITEFFDSATADSAIVIANGSAVTHAAGGSTNFENTSTAGNATLLVNGGSAGGLGGTILFEDDSSGGTARVEVFGIGTGDTSNGNLDLSFHNAPGVTIGSIEGNGAVFLGSSNLAVGSNNLSTTFSGIIQDGGIGGGTGGSLTKIGTGTLVLTNTSTYTGGTTINSGTLLVQNRSGSGTGGGAVQVDAGILGGRGTIAGAVTLGTGSGAGAVLAPGRRGGKPGNPLTIQNTLTFKSDATYRIGLNSVHAVADNVIANGVTIDGAALFSFVGSGYAHLPLGAVFVVIENTSGTPIAGTFTNLTDGSAFTANGNTFRASYEGGDGNDLTLTVVPQP